MDEQKIYFLFLFLLFGQKISSGHKPLKVPNVKFNFDVCV